MVLPYRSSASYVAVTNTLEWVSLNEADSSHQQRGADQDL